MKDFNTLSGPWEGWSIQDGVRISEKMNLTIRAQQILGTGIDKDGEFEISGAYIERRQQVVLTRRYTWTAEPSQSGVGIPYEYEGTWDGTMVSGLWHPRWNVDYGGPFEMWPATDEDKRELSLEMHDFARG